MSLGIVLAFAFVVSSVVQPTEAGLEDEETYLRETAGILEECGNGHLLICIKEIALKYIEQLPSNLDLGGGLKVMLSEGVKRSSRYMSASSLPNDPRVREGFLDGALIERAVNYVSSHTFQWKLPEETVGDVKRALDGENYVGDVEEARKKKKKGMQLMYLLQLKAAAVGAIMLKIIGFVAFKALILAKIALTIASLIGLKKLVDDKHHHTSTYEVVAPHYEDHGHYLDRSFKPVELPYQGYAENKNNF